MNDMIKAMVERRSIRKFKPDAVSGEDVNTVIEAGLYAASGRGYQSVKIIAVIDKELRNRISEENRKIGGWAEGFDPFYGAPVILIVIADKSRPTFLYDGSLVLGNMMLAAHTLGLGSCWIHRAREEFESGFGKEILERLSIEGEWEGIGHCALGYADGELPKAPERKPDRVYYVK
ncbi:MAG: nitroreductase [Clostridia bacterium]|nr:nitroreductase [Clostridia bacterium]